MISNTTFTEIDEIAAPAAAAAGKARIYPDSTTHTVLISQNGGGFLNVVTSATGSTISLNNAYHGGSTITVDSGPVTLNKSVNDATHALVVNVTGGTGLAALFSGNVQITGTLANLTAVRRVVSTNTTLAATDFLVGLNSTGGGFTLTMPAPAAAIAGRLFLLKDEGGLAGVPANNITISGNGGNINGQANFILNTNYESIILYTDGTNWFTIA
jgi:hypothetical protein